MISFGAKLFSTVSPPLRDITCRGKRHLKQLLGMGGEGGGGGGRGEISERGASYIGHCL